MGMLGDWGAHIIDYLHDKLDMGLPTEIKVQHLEDYNKTIFLFLPILSLQPLSAESFFFIYSREPDREAPAPKIENGELITRTPIEKITTPEASM
ncbi:hypothetical protein N9921_03875, partial [Akkermansiaceae bacterium]|nr:hypothetical protein [Akkermansiaceae bacterium]